MAGPSHVWKGGITLAEIFRTNNNWRRYLSWQEGQVRDSVRHHIRRMLSCRTPRLGVHLYRCDHCGTQRIIPHSCKSPACASCGKVRTDAWCSQLLSDILDVRYRHLVFTIPWQLRLIIRDNRRLLNVLLRSAADAVLSLTAGQPKPMGRKGRKWVEGRRRRYLFLPGIIAVVHTFGSDLKWNPHIHLVLTAGGMSLDGQRWVAGPSKYLAPAPALATEWKLRLIAGIRHADDKQRLYRRRLRSDRRRRINLDLLLGHVRKQKWHILVGPSLQTADKAVRYACRYTKRPVIAEGRIKSFKNGYVTFQFKDYHKGGKRAFSKLPVLKFIDRVVQHLPERNFRQVRHYGLFSPRKRKEGLKTARRLLAQRKKRRCKTPDWEQRRKAAGVRRPLSCPRCGSEMVFDSCVFGCHRALAKMAGVAPDDQIPPQTFYPPLTNEEREIAA